MAIAQKQNNEVALLQAELYGAMAEQERNPSAYNPNFFEQRIPKLDSLGLQLEKARVHKYVAGIYAFFGDVSKAIASHLKAQTYYESKGDLAGIASVYNDLSLIYYDQHDYDEAFRYAHQSLSFEEKNGKPGRIHTSTNNLAIIFEHTGPVDSAIYYHKKALVIAGKMQDPFALSLTLSNLGNNYVAKGDLKAASDALYEALRLRDSMQNIRGLAYTHNRLANLNLKMGDIVKAEYHASQSLTYAKRASEVKVIRMAYERLMEVAEKKGDAKNELRYLKLVNQLTDSIRSESNTKEITQLVLNYGFEKQQLLDSIANTQKLREQELLFNERMKVARNRQIIFFVSGLLLLVVAFGWWRRYRYIKKSTAIIAKEKERSDELLLNILPSAVAEELKEKGYSEAQDFDQVTVIFTDFADFTKKAQNLSAKALVHELNACFKAFDRIVEQTGLEKIKTIGDAYMAVGGLHKKTGAYDVVCAALQMRNFIAQRNTDDEGNVGFDMRIGINTGPVVAGIVGIKKFQYDIWGDTVNTAQRMEASCELNKVNISQRTYELIKDRDDLQFTPRGSIAVKGKGELSMWYVESKA